MTRRDIVVIGGSMGSLAPLRLLLGGLPADLPAYVFVTTHVPTQASGHLSEVLATASALPLAAAADGQPIVEGHIHLAVPGRHLLLIDHMTVLGAGPRENMVRPSIDPMFRSAALSFGPRVIGVVLSGLLNDGAAGLAAIKEMGGVALVQHPLDAEAPDMPRAALEVVDADHVVPAGELAGLIGKLVASEAPKPRERDADELALEVEIAAGRRLGSGRLSAIGSPAALSCPHCHGVLSEMKPPGPLRYRCQIGHAFTAEALVEAQQQSVDEAVRVAMRIMEERAELVTRMARDARAQGRTAVAELYEARAKEYEAYAATLRRAATLSLRMGRAVANPGQD
jgi:two-component system, chemotaxis family, protein-glutamate methylesterase/glutaminase